MLERFMRHHVDKQPAPQVASADDVVVRTYQPADWLAIRRLYSDGLLEGRVDPHESTSDLDDPLLTYFSHPDDRLWVAEFEGRIVGMISVGHIGHHVAQIRRLRVDATFRETDLPARLLKVVLQHCRRCGDLKLIVDAHVDPHQAVAACRDGGFQYTRARRNGGHETLEFYLNLYRQPRSGLEQEQPRRAPHPPRLRQMLA
ncbi:MAG: GNAT family N-acetyltransferase [Phycisphaeraceae bacterium]